MDLVIDNQPPVSFMEQIHVGKRSTLGAPVGQHLIGCNSYRPHLPVLSRVFPHLICAQRGPQQQFPAPLFYRSRARSKDQCLALQLLQHRKADNCFACPAGQHDHTAAAMSAGSLELADSLR